MGKGEQAHFENLVGLYEICLTIITFFLKKISYITVCTLFTMRAGYHMWGKMFLVWIIRING